MTNRRKFIIAIIVVIGIIALPFIKDRQGIIWPTQKTLAVSHLPALISRAAFVGPVKADFKVSPGGRYLSWWQDQTLCYRAIGSDRIHQIRPKGNFSYAFSDLRQQVYLKDKDGYWIIDLKNPQKKNWRNVTPKRRNLHFLSFPTEENPHWLFLSYSRNPAHQGVNTYRYDVQGKNGQLVDQGNMRTYGYFYSPYGDLVLRLQRLATQSTLFEIRNKDKWRSLLTRDVYDTFRVAGLSVDKTKAIWALSNRGRDKIAAVAVDRKTGKEKVFYENPRVDLTNFYIDKKAATPAYVRFYDPYLNVLTFDNRYKKVWNLALQQKHTNALPVSFSEDLTKSVFQISIGGATAYDTYLIDTKTNTRKRIYKSSASKFNDRFSKTQPLWLKGRDGLKMRAFLTLPKNVAQGPLPLVLLVHGGPALRDYIYVYIYGNQNMYGEQRIVQFLANRGYAVLRVNFRGSTGYGQKFKDAGYGQMGGSMQNDLDDAVRWAIDKGIADPNAIAIVGSSYGGYAALTAAWRGSGLYKAAIAIAPVTNMMWQTTAHPRFWGPELKRWTAYTGDPKNAKVRKHLRAISAIYHARDFSIPLLLIHGDSDKIVDVRQSKDLEKKLKKWDKNVEALYLKGERHILLPRKTDNRILALDVMEKFLAKYLGGRAER